MTDWVKRQAAEIGEIEARKRADRDWSLHADAVIPRKAPMIWERLAGCLREDVKAYNELVVDSARQFSYSRQDNEVLIRRTYYPDVRITVMHDVNARRVIWETVITKTTESEPSRTVGHFGFYLDHTDELHLTDARGNLLACDEAAKDLLQPVFALWR